MMNAHEKGKSIVGIYTKEIAIPSVTKVYDSPENTTIPFFLPMSGIKIL